MKTFDYEQVRAVLSPLKEKFEDCAHGEGNQCATLDKSLDCCANICFEVVEALTDWAHNVFSGEVVFDPGAENLWRTEVEHIYKQAIRLWLVGRKAELPCYDLPGQGKLQAALWQLNWTIQNWVSPKLAVGPSARARINLGESQLDKARKQLAELPPLLQRGK